MTLAPLLNSSPVIQAHAYAAFAAVILGAAQLGLPKGSRRHRTMGYLFAALMMLIAGSSFFIHTIRTFGPFSPIHGLSLFTLIIVPVGIYAARRGDVRAHAFTMGITYVSALLITGLFTLWPGRIMYKVVFGA